MTELTITGPLEPAALATAVAAVVRCHPTLRTRLDRDGDRLVQTVRNDLPEPAVEVHDLRGVSDQETRLNDLISHLCAQPLDLDTGQVFRASLFALSDHAHRLVIASDHLATDGWSIDIISTDLLTILDAIRTDPQRDPNDILGRRRHQYADWADHQWRLIASDYGAAHSRYWTERLAGAPDLVLPEDRSASSELGPAIFCAERCGPELVARLDALSRQEKLTRPIVLLSMLFAMLRRRTGQTDLCVTLPTDGRGPDFMRAVGYFTSQLIVRVEIPEILPLERLSRVVRDAWLETYQWRHIPAFAGVALRPGLWRLAFNYLRSGSLPQPLGLAVQAGVLRGPRMSYSELDLALVVRETQNDLLVALMGRRDKFELETLQGLLRDFLALGRDGF